MWLFHKKDKKQGMWLTMAEVFDEGGFQWGAILPTSPLPTVPLPVSGDIFDCQNYGVSATGIEWAEVRDAANHLAMHGAAPPTTKTDLLPNVSSAEVEKSWSIRNWEPTLITGLPLEYKHNCYLVTLMYFYHPCHICINIHKTEKDKFLLTLWVHFYDKQLSICTVIIFKVEYSYPQL